jgi:cellulose 1,4-beta-cellobiosidase
VRYDGTAEWSDGFVASVTVTNTGATALDGWTLAYTFGGDQQITSSWSSTYSQTGAAVTMRNAGWNGRVAPGAGVTFGLQGRWSASNAAPTAFTLNESPCAVG